MIFARARQARRARPCVTSSTCARLSPSVGTTTELDLPRGPAANCVEPRRRYGEVGLCASGSIPRRMAKDSTVVTTLA